MFHQPPNHMWPAQSRGTTALRFSSPLSQLSSLPALFLPSSPPSQLSSLPTCLPSFQLTSLPARLSIYSYSCAFTLKDASLDLPPSNSGSHSYANPFTIPPSSSAFNISVKAPSFTSTDSSSDVDSDGLGSGYASSADSWDMKLKLLVPDLSPLSLFAASVVSDVILLPL